MDNLTHSLVGLTTAKAGLERLSPFATTVCILAANSPDVDVVVGLFSDRWTLLKHHRGITHSIIGTLALGILVPIVFYLLERAISHFRKRSSKIRLGGLLIASLITAATHPIMDWTNNYGVRPFLPWSGRWFYGDLVFVVDPYIWLILGGAAFMLTSNQRFKVVGWSLFALAITALILFGPGRAAAGASLGLIRVVWLTGAVLFVLARVLKFNERFGSRVAVSALAFVVLYWGGLSVAHSFALQSTSKYTSLFVNPQNELVLKTAAMPTLGDPRLWVCVVETNQAIYRYSTKVGSLEPFYFAYWMVDDPYRMENNPAVQRFPKPTGADQKLVERASQDRRAQILQGFARFPVAEVAGEDCLTQTLVQFADVRYTEPGAARGSFSVNVPVDCPAR
jgi:membrane-bound metal-dependent hydrolase YbcI (DUF457 family)